MEAAFPDSMSRNGRATWTSPRSPRPDPRSVYCRASYGTGPDSRIGDNWPKAKAVGLLRGAYHGLVAGEDGAAQAQAFLGVFQGAGMGYGPGDLPPAADVEGPDRPGLGRGEGAVRRGAQDLGGDRRPGVGNGRR